MNFLTIYIHGKYFCFNNFSITSHRNEKKKCLEPCRDFSYKIQSTMSSYPAQPTFIYSRESCILLTKFIQVCKDQAR